MPIITNIEDLRVLHQKRTPKMFYDYADSGSWTESTYRANESDFQKIKLRQRVAVNMQNRTTKTTMVGQEVAMPVALAPTGLTGMQYPDGEILAAQAAEKFGLDIEPFDGLYPDQAQKFFDQVGIQKHPAKLKRDSPGVLGCAASHFCLWQQCRDSNEPYVILEHDAYMIRPMPLTVVFDDVLKLDSCNPFGADYDACVAVEKPQGI
ncbi:MAG: hypothetical protein EBY85_05520, partial [Burkholderiaceae bacterium]|nr:hypothetical protein [Burkholderiaceae bacterium]